MKINRLFAIIFIITLWPAATIWGRMDPATDTTSLIKEWEARLTSATTPDDSLTILYNLYDLIDRNYYSTPYVKQLYDLAGREKEYEIQLDLLRNAGGKYVRNDSLIAVCLDEARKIPGSYDQRETVVFLEVQLYNAKLLKLSVAERLALLPSLIEGYNDDIEKDIYSRILSMYKISLAMGKSVGGELYSDYLDRLKILVDHLPKGNDALKSLFYTQSAVAYSINDESRKAVKADRELLHIIDSLRHNHDLAGRPYHSYSTNEYLSYRRMLGNYDVLSKEEIEEYHDSIESIARTNRRVMHDKEYNKRADVYYLCATGQYSKALPMLKSMIDIPQNSTYRRKLLRMMIEAAEKTGDVNTQLHATTEYNKLLEQMISQQITDKVRDMQVFYDVNDIKDGRINRIISTADSEISNLKQEMTGMYILVILFALVSLVAVAMWLRSRRRNKNK